MENLTEYWIIKERLAADLLPLNCTFEETSADGLIGVLTLETPIFFRAYLDYTTFGLNHITDVKRVVKEDFVVDHILLNPDFELTPYFPVRHQIIDVSDDLTRLTIRNTIFDERGAK